MTQETDLDLRDYVYLIALAPAILGTHAFAVRLSRAVELTGRLQGRSTVNLLSGGLSLLNLFATAAICRLSGIPLGMEEGAGVIDVALAALIALAVGFLLCSVAAMTVRFLPDRRRTGPNRRANSFLAWLTTATKVLLSLVVVLLVISLIGAYLEQFELGFGALGLADWAGLFLAPILLVALALYIRRGQRKVTSYANRLRPSPEDSAEGKPRVLYLRPFDEEHRLFAGSQTLDEFLGDDIAKQIGPLIALGNPTDRISPDGAERHYYQDDDWQSAVETLALEAPCIVAATSASPNTAWELGRVLELGLERRIYLLSPPKREAQTATAASDAEAGPIRRALRIARRATFSWLAQDLDGLSREVSLGQLPSALSPAGMTPWHELVETLAACGYSVDFSDPGPGSVIGFETGGMAVILEQGATSPIDYIKPIVDRSMHPQPPGPQPPM